MYWENERIDRTRPATRAAFVSECPKMTDAALRPAQSPFIRESVQVIDQNGHSEMPLRTDAIFAMSATGTPSRLSSNPNWMHHKGMPRKQSQRHHGLSSAREIRFSDSAALVASIDTGIRLMSLRKSRPRLTSREWLVAKADVIAKASTFLRTPSNGTADRPGLQQTFAFEGQFAHGQR